jgi:hypothetical protein
VGDVRLLLTVGESGELFALDQSVAVGELDVSEDGGSYNGQGSNVNLGRFSRLTIPGLTHHGRRQR